MDGSNSQATLAAAYATNCVEVLAAANACLEAANLAASVRTKIALHENDGLPGTPIAIRNFTKMAEEAEHEFGSLYPGFEEACTTARDTAASLLETQEELNPETVLMMSVDEEVLDSVATVKAILRSNYGPTPEAFKQGVAESNDLMKNPPDEGNIYTPLSLLQPDEKTCPWCAETIKAAAVICRFCGRDVETQPNLEDH